MSFCEVALETVRDAVPEVGLEEGPEVGPEIGLDGGLDMVCTGCSKVEDDVWIGGGKGL